MGNPSPNLEEVRHTFGNSGKSPWEKNLRTPGFKSVALSPWNLLCPIQLPFWEP